MRHFTQLWLCLLCVAMGCEGRAITDLNGVRITAVGSPNQINVVDDSAKIKVGEKEYAVAVENSRLSINGSDYGPVTKTDQVTISDDQITINGKPAKVVSAE
jgi:hypothetical protein